MWGCREATVPEIRAALEDPPSYSTVRKTIERLEEKGAVARVRRQGRAWTYRSAVSATAMIRKEIRRFLTVVFDGSAAPLVSQLAKRGGQRRKPPARRKRIPRRYPARPR